MLDGAAELFRDRGFAGIRVPELVEQLGICRQSLYRLFGDKRGFFLRALDHYAAAELDPLLNRLQGSADPLETVLELVRGWPDHARNGRCLLARTAMDGGDDPEVQERIGHHIGRLRDALRDALAKACKLGQLRADSDIHSLTGALLAAMQGVSVMCGLPHAEEHLSAASLGIELLLQQHRRH